MSLAKDEIATLYKNAHNLHYEDQEYRKARSLYKEIIKNAPKSQEASWASTQLGNLESHLGKDDAETQEETSETELQMYTKKIVGQDEPAEGIRSEDFEGIEKFDITMSTGDLKCEYEILDVIFAIDRHDAGFFANVFQKFTGFKTGSASPAIAFKKAINQLKAQCIMLGGNAVINCKFEHRIAAANLLPGLALGESLMKGMGSASKQVVEIFAYGTAVKRLNS